MGLVSEGGEGVHVAVRLCQLFVQQTLTAHTVCCCCCRCPPHPASCHASPQLLTRLFRFDKTDVLLPIVDMANHEVSE
jgi:hypothetical protein